MRARRAALAAAVTAITASALTVHHHAPAPHVATARLLAYTGTSQADMAFIAAVAPGAVAAQKIYGVPAAVTIAQAIDESGWGQSSLAAQYNNLFGIKGTGPAGSVTLPTQEYENGGWVTVNAQFRAYHNYAESISDHALLLATSGYYTQAMADRGSPDTFANDLTGVYATDPTYGSTLIKFMTTYNLYPYDNAAAPAQSHVTLPAGTPAAVTVAVSYAQSQIGKPYTWGGAGPDSFDCSGLVMMAYKAAGIAIPRTSQLQWAAGNRIPAGQERPGDLVFFAGGDGTATSPGHVGLVIGKGTMIESYGPGTSVRISTYGQASSPAGDGTVVGFTRPVTAPAASPSSSPSARPSATPSSSPSSAATPSSSPAASAPASPSQSPEYADNIPGVLTPGATPGTQAPAPAATTPAGNGEANIPGILPGS